MNGSHLLRGKVGIRKPNCLVEVALVNSTQNGIDGQVACAVPDIVNHTLEAWGEVRQGGIARSGVGALETKLVSHPLGSVPPVKM